MLPSNYITATEAIALVTQEQLTIDQVLKDHKDQYEQRNDQVKAWVCIDHTGNKALEGPLQGMIIGVKDIINTKSFPTEYGSKIYKANQVGQDAAVVALFKFAGASIIGKTTVNEFAYVQNKMLTTNPIDREYRPGVSSTGSGAAVADFQCHVGIGTQTTTSIIRPASYCGIFGFKPTWGLVSLEGVRPVEPLTDSIGILARSITDIELVAKTLGVFRNQIPDLTYTTLKQCQFGFFVGELDHLASEGVKLVWEKAKLALSNAGAVVEDVDFGEEFKGWEGVDGKLGRIMNSAADISTFKDYMVNRGQLPESILQAAENGVPRQETVKMYDQLAALRPRFDELAGQYDAIITLSTLVEPPKMSENDVPDFGALWSCLHAPTLCVPGLAGVNGLPVGLTMVAPRYQDERLVHVAKFVAEVFIEAGKDDLRKVPAPGGVVALKP